MSRTTLFAVATVLLASCGGYADDPQALSGKGDMVGNRGPDTNCTFTWQCSQDDSLVCRPSGERDYSGDWIRTCQPRGASGARCRDDAHCMDGYQCQDLGYYYPGRCTDQNLGKPCQFFCLGEEVCRPVSRSRFGPQFRCLPRGGENEPCRDNLDCVDGLGCHGAEFNLLGMLERAGSCLTPAAP